MFSYVTMEQRIAADHPIRGIRVMVDGAMRGMDAALGEHAGRLPAHTLRRGLAYQELMIRWIDDLLAALDDRRATA